ncbi:unnamed protein product [Pleuronectes platessa]|uniref:Uncharacterized protein n=1 Tax=Pleuronectes platessa TaxID=8262 RepID=A0A9N7UYJ2_PLEPL|nr:unnamed protein product [Pleuronectes platessa]
MFLSLPPLVRENPAISRSQERQGYLERPDYPTAIQRFEEESRKRSTRASLAGGGGGVVVVGVNIQLAPTTPSCHRHPGSIINKASSNPKASLPESEWTDRPSLPSLCYIFSYALLFPQYLQQCLENFGKTSVVSDLAAAAGDGSPPGEATGTGKKGNTDTERKTVKGFEICNLFWV